MDTVYAVIGDLVGSRGARSRQAAQTALGHALEATSAVVPPLDRLEPTVGDEFQGVYADLAAATTAALLVRLHLLGSGAGVDARAGIGVGGREVFDAAPRPVLQDGPAWWAARAAVDRLGERAHRRRRTWFAVAEGLEAAVPDPALVNAFLVTRDALLDRVNDRGLRVLRLLLEGRAQQDVAEAEGITPSAVSQLVGRGVGAVRDAQLVLAEVGRARA